MVQSFSMPAILDIKLIIVIICCVSILVFSILYANDFKNRNKAKRSIKKASIAFYVILVGLASVILLTFFGQGYNNSVFAQKVTHDYKVNVLNVENNYNINVILGNNILPCQGTYDTKKTYVVFCHTDYNSVLPLDEIVRDSKL